VPTNRLMVYLRTKVFKRKKDPKPRTYYYLVEAKRTGNVVRQKVVRYLGSADSILKTYEEFDRLKISATKAD